MGSTCWERWGKNHLEWSISEIKWKKINERKHYNTLAVSKSEIIKAGTFEQVSHMEKLHKI